MRRAKGTIYVFTFKEGMLSAAAHDLRLRLENFEITLEAEDIRAELDLRSLFVDGPIEGGVLKAEHYDAAKRRDVEKAMHEEVLRTDEFPKALFVGRAVPSVNGFDVSGVLELAGKEAPLSFSVREQAGTYESVFELSPSAWAIAPYKALLGAIRVKNSVRVEVTLTDA